MRIKQEQSYYTFADGISKTNKLSYVAIITKESKYDLTMLKIINRMLKHRTKKHDRQTFAIECAKNYDLSLNRASEDLFNYLILEYSLTYIDEKYVPDFKFEDAKELLIDYMENQTLDENDFNQVLKSMKIELDILKNDYTKYARRLARDLMYQEDENYQTISEYEDQLNTLTLNDLIEFYRQLKVKKTYILHKTNNEKVIKLPLVENPLDVKRYKTSSAVLEPSIVDLGIDQAKVNIIYDLDKKASRELLSVFNLIFGGDSFSKLFTNVRETHSICYSINSQVVNRDFIQVQTGVNEDNIELVINLIDEQLEAIKDGDVTEIDNAKDKLISLYRAIINDYPSRKNLMERNIIYNEKRSIEEIIDAVKAVKAEDVITLAQKINKNRVVVVK